MIVMEGRALVTPSALEPRRIQGWVLPVRIWHPPLMAVQLGWLVAHNHHAPGSILGSATHAP